MRESATQVFVDAMLLVRKIQPRVTHVGMEVSLDGVWRFTAHEGRDGRAVALEMTAVQMRSMVNDPFQEAFRHLGEMLK